MQKRGYFLKRGISIVELVVYCAIFALMLVIVTNGIVRLGQVYGLARNERKVSNVASVALERIVRELALACKVTNPTPENPSGTTITFIAYANFNPSPSPGMADYKTCLDNAGGRVSKTIALGTGADANRIKLDSQFLSPTASTVKVTQLLFQKLMGGQNDQNGQYDSSEAIRIALRAEAGAGDYKIDRVYYATTILRNSY